MIAVLFALIVSTAHAENGHFGQNEWCWVNRQGTMFCDYTTPGACWDRNRGQEGTCVRR